MNGTARAILGATVGLLAVGLLTCLLSRPGHSEGLKTALVALPRVEGAECLKEEMLGLLARQRLQQLTLSGIEEAEAPRILVIEGLADRRWCDE